MANDTGEFEEQQVATPANEVIRRFLLGSATSDEQTRLEASLFTDEALEERVCAAECELADDYAFQRLSAAERELFEKNYLVSRDRKRKLEVSVALRQHLAAAAAAKEGVGVSSQGAHVSLRERIIDWLGLDRPALGFAIALVLLLVFGSVVWVAIKNRRARQQIIARHPVVTATPQYAHAPSPAPKASVSPKLTPKPTPTEPESISVLATVLLLPNAVRDGGEMARVTIPREPPGDHSIVRLELALEIDEPGSQSAELLTAEGVSVYAGNKLRTNSAGSTRRVVFEVPARLLQSGDYQVKLNWIVGGSVTASRRYYFRVTQ